LTDTGCGTLKNIYNNNNVNVPFRVKGFSRKSRELRQKTGNVTSDLKTVSSHDSVALGINCMLYEKQTTKNADLISVFQHLKKRKYKRGELKGPVSNTNCSFKERAPPAG